MYTVKYLKRNEREKRKEERGIKSNAVGCTIVKSCTDQSQMLLERIQIKVKCCWKEYKQKSNPLQ